MNIYTYLFKGVLPTFGLLALISSGFPACERIIECLGFVDGGGAIETLPAGPASDMRILLVEDFFTVLGTGKLDLALP